MDVQRQKYLFPWPKILAHETNSIRYANEFNSIRYIYLVIEVMGNEASRSSTTKKPLLSRTSQLNELYVQHQEAVVAAWSQESCCTYFMRMAGLENGISSTEKRKEMQHYHPFIPGHHQHMHTIDSQLLEQYGLDPTAHEAILRVQKCYRSYRAIARFQDCIWTLVLSLRKDAQKKQELINAATFLKVRQVLHP